MKNFIFRHKWSVLLALGIISYILYFSWYTILRYQSLYASYYDLGIMHQTVYNSYQAMATGDWSRFLELTDPLNSDQIKRMAIHNDMILGLLGIFYFIHAGPETLLVIQAVATALGAVGVFLLAKKVIKKEVLAFILAFSYLLYPAAEKANLYDFHAVILATPLLIFMFYCWATHRYRLSFLLLLFSLITKEEVALTTFVFGVYVLLHPYLAHPKRLKTFKLSTFVKTIATEPSNARFAIAVIAVSAVWFYLSLFYFIPFFRGSHHFALARYADSGGSPLDVILVLLKNPWSILTSFFNGSAVWYVFQLWGPVGFLTLLAPLHVLIPLPEYAINLLSKEANMRNIYFHYTAVITPFVFISAIYGMTRARDILVRKKVRAVDLIVGGYVCLTTLVFALWQGPLPFSYAKDIHAYAYPQKEADIVAVLAKKYADPNLKISTTGQLAPHFTSRRYFYTFSDRYPLADYIVIRLNEVYNYPERDELIPVYQRLVKDPRFMLEGKYGDIIVYKKK